MSAVGTEQITPPLPKKYASPLKGGLAFFLLARDQDLVLRRVQVQAEVPRRVASVNRRRDQLSPEGAKAILPLLLIFGCSNAADHRASFRRGFFASWGWRNPRLPAKYIPELTDFA